MTCMVVKYDKYCIMWQNAQITGRSSVGITNTTFLGNVDGNSQGGAFAVAQGGLVQACSCLRPPEACNSCFPVLVCIADRTNHSDCWQLPQILVGYLQVVNSRFAANSASRGGAIYSEGASVMIMNSQFSDNAATTTGGAMYVAEQSALTILNSTFSNNRAGTLAQSVSQAFPCPGPWAAPA